KAIAGEPELRRLFMHRGVMQVVEWLDEIVAQAGVLDELLGLRHRVVGLAGEADDERPARYDALVAQPANAVAIRARRAALLHVLEDLIGSRFDAEKDALAAAARDLGDQRLIDELTAQEGVPRDGKVLADHAVDQHLETLARNVERVVDEEQRFDAPLAAFA